MHAQLIKDFRNAATRAPTFGRMTWRSSGRRQRCIVRRSRTAIAPAFVFMAAPCRSSFIAGEILPVIGGNDA